MPIASSWAEDRDVGLQFLGLGSEAGPLVQGTEGRERKTPWGKGKGS